MPEITNLLLRLMPEEDRMAIMSAATRVALTRRQILDEAWRPCRCVHFIESGTVSALSVAGGTHAGELGVVGYEGMTGTSLLFGDDQSEAALRVDVAGYAYRVPAAVFVGLLRRRPALAPFLLRFARSQALQIATTVAANSHSDLDARLARRLVMTLDRSSSRILAITHQELSLPLWTTRPNVTAAMHRLEIRRLIHTMRGSVQVTDRDGLVRLASEIYGPAEDGYARLMGADFRLNLGFDKEAMV